MIISGVERQVLGVGILVQVGVCPYTEPSCHRSLKGVDDGTAFTCLMIANDTGDDFRRIQRLQRRTGTERRGRARLAGASARATCGASDHSDAAPPCSRSPSCDGGRSVRLKADERRP